MSITNKIQCNITKLWYGISQDRKEKLIKKHGSEENLIKNYICRDARNLIKQGYAKDKIPNLIANKNLQPKQHNQTKKIQNNDEYLKLINATSDDPDVFNFLNTGKQKI